MFSFLPTGWHQYKLICSRERNYVEFARTRMGWAADADHGLGTEAVAELERFRCGSRARCSSQAS